MQTIMSIPRGLLHYIPNAIDLDYSNTIFDYLKDCIAWEDGIRSKAHGVTRKAKSIDPTQYPEILGIIMHVLQQFYPDVGMGIITPTIYGTYINYYRDGNDFTPIHNHPSTIQLVISLGATRTLTVGTKTLSMNSGDAVIFGVQKHGVPKDLSVSGGRISIATFIKL